MTPGSNGDGRPDVEIAGWQEFAARNKVALVGCRFTDKPHDQGFIEEYVNVSRGSGKALETALSAFAERSKHPELATAPLLLWGMSAGGQFNYEFVAWKPERVAAFVVNKGGIYYSALLSRDARKVPGILFVGGKDMDSRIATITGLFAVNRRGGACGRAIVGTRKNVLRRRAVGEGRVDAPVDVGKGRVCCRPEDENIPDRRSLSARRSFDGLASD
jgi:pimeloyl-ACP methyl ester carboxylesterase